MKLERFIFAGPNSFKSPHRNKGLYITVRPTGPGSKANKKGKK
jgi:hypothetical protein